jgi:D-alanine-D-alanine ligase
MIDSPEQLPAAIMSAFSCADVVLIEQRIAGTEIAITVLDGTPLPAVEIQPKRGDYDFSARYTAGATEFHAPARLPDDIQQACAAAASQAYSAVGSRHISRIDAIVDANGVPYIIELDTCPGLTQTSLVPLAAEAAGLSFTDLCTQLVSFALRDA